MHIFCKRIFLNNNVGIDNYSLVRFFLGLYHIFNNSVVYTFNFKYFDYEKVCLYCMCLDL